MLTKGLLTAIIVTLIDQIHKWFMLDVMDISHNSPTAVTPFFNLVMVWNRGISFGLFNNTDYSQYIFSAIACAIIVYLIYWMKNMDKLFPVISIGFIIGGAAGNVLDRLRFGAVADFFDFYIGQWHWPAFNIADTAVFTGAIMLCMYMIWQERIEKQTKE